VHEGGEPISIATLACDAGDRYADTIYDDAWLASRSIDITIWQMRLATLAAEPGLFAKDLARARGSAA